MSWPDAWWRGLLVVVYFVVATVLLPDFVAGSSLLEGGSDLLQDTVLSLVWIIPLAGGLYGLRRAQQAGAI